ncbi:MAG TPA: class I SAM-dependent methyltransferase [Acidimicrobiales bacterium]|jgi:SAM-dependent methyltransferase|nr:class I SAM-dependent methyltransferase [Acidimicrobiales bacterium]
MDRQGWEERYSAREQMFVRDPNRLVVAEVEGLAPGRALDVATGEGRHAVWLASRGWTVAAVDFSVVGVTRAAARARAEGRSVAFAAADVYTLRLPPGSFDLVLCSFFHPPPDQRRQLYPAVATGLAPGGSLVQVSYDVRNATEGTGGPKDPAMLIDPPVVAAELAALGLTVTRADTVRLRTPTPDGEEVEVVDAIIHAVKP